jgi:hypothetical protein
LVLFRAHLTEECIVFKNQAGNFKEVNVLLIQLVNLCLAKKFSVYWRK